MLLKFMGANVKFNGNLLLDYLSDQVTYTSQHVAEDLIGKEVVSQYLIQRYKHFELHQDQQKRSFQKAYATGGSDYNRPCLVISINGKKGAYVFLEINTNNKITYIQTLSIPLHSIKIVKKFESEN